MACQVHQHYAAYRAGSETRVVLEKVQKAVDMNSEVRFDEMSEIFALTRKDDGTDRLIQEQVMMLDEDLYFVLTDKTEGDALVRVMSGVEGRGFAAFARLHRWFAGTTGLGIAERVRQVMHPATPKKEDEIPEAM